MATGANVSATATATNKKKAGTKSADDRSEDVRGRVWSEEEYEIFVDIWRSQDIQAKIDGTVRNNAAFAHIAKKMSDMGFERTTKEIKNKIKNVKRDYKKVIDHNRRSGVAPKTVPLKEKLDEILGDRPIAQPVAVFQSGGEEDDGQLHQDIGNDLNESPDQDPEEADWDVDMMDLSSDLSGNTLSVSVGLVPSTSGMSGESTSASDVGPSSPTMPTRTCRSEPPTTRPSQHDQAAGNDVSNTAANEGSHSHQPTLRDTNKRPRSETVADVDGTRKAPRSTKKTRMRETISTVAEAFQVHMDRSDHAYREEMRKQRREEQEWEQRWRQQRAEEQSAFNNTMQTFLASVTGMMAQFMASRQVAAHQAPSYGMTQQQMTPQQMTPQRRMGQQTTAQQMTARSSVHRRPYAGLPRPSVNPNMSSTTPISPALPQSSGPSAATRITYPNGDTTVLQGDKEYRTL